MKGHNFFGLITVASKNLIHIRLFGFLSVVTTCCWVYSPAVAQDRPSQNVQAKPGSPARMPADADPSFEVATIKPADPNDPNDGLHLNGRHIGIENQTIDSLLMFAYGIHQKQIVNAPAWTSAEHFDVDGVPDAEGEPSLKQLQVMMKKFLADRFQLRFHHEQRELEVYALCVAKGGPKITASKSDPNALGDENANHHGIIATMKVTNMSMADFVMILEFSMDKPVVDQTGLAGKWDFAWRWATDESHVSTDANAPPGMFTAIQEQLGLKLEAVKGPADVFVIDHVERSSPN
jgi:uncharacterized protein (TIGR03435 family)